MPSPGAVHLGRRGDGKTGGRRRISTHDRSATYAFKSLQAGGLTGHRHLGGGCSPAPRPPHTEPCSGPSVCSILSPNVPPRCLCCRHPPSELLPPPQGSGVMPSTPMSFVPGKWAVPAWAGPPCLLLHPERRWPFLFLIVQCSWCVSCPVLDL